jgi:DNA-binding NtrC family response regulator
VDVFAGHGTTFRRSHRMRAVGEIVRTVARLDVPVFIDGEAGVGKAQIARSIHDLSARSGKPWSKVNCASLPPDILGAELFGAEETAAGGHGTRKSGRFELAQGGTIFLDEIGEAPIDLQSRILRVLEGEGFPTLGGRTPARTDVRVIAATSHDLQGLVKRGLFLTDLFHSLTAIRIRIPALRERREEIPSLVDHFREQFGQRFGRESPSLSADTLEILMAYAWPGNIGELENLMKRYVVLGDENQLRSELESRQEAIGTRATGETPLAGGLRDVARQAAREAERAAIRDALERAQWNRRKAAKALKISYKTLLHKVNRDGVGVRSSEALGSPPGTHAQPDTFDL